MFSKNCVIFLYITIFYHALASADISNLQPVTSNVEQAALVELIHDKTIPNTLLIRFHIQKGYKLYSNIDGDVGSPLRIELKNTKNIKDWHLTFPEATKIVEDIGEGNKLTSYVYNGDIDIALNITSINKLEPVHFMLSIHYATCSTYCTAFNEEIPYTLHPERARRTTVEVLKEAILAVITAVIGGFILNFMPCVLPILSVKIAYIIQQSELSRIKIRLHMIFTTAGILVSFIILAISVILIRSAGHAVGWGMHFHNPLFLIFLIIVVILVACNLWGLFEIRLPQVFLNKLAKIKLETGYLGSFITGILSMLMATPCTAPIVSTITAFALASSNTIILLIYASLGIGLSTPYLLLTISPSLLQMLPKPGPWMAIVKKLLAVIFLFVAVWLAVVLNQHLSISTVYNVGNNSTKLINKYSNYIAFNRKELNQYIDDGKVVIVDVTADWCITCKYNKLFVLEQKELLAQLLQEGVIYMVADYTINSKEVAEFLAEHNRNGIPFNVVYSSKLRDGVVLPEILTRKAILDAIAQAK